MLTVKSRPKDNRPFFLFDRIKKGVEDKCWTQFWSRPKWAPIIDMGRDMPRPTTRIKLEKGATKIAQQEAEIAELPRRSRSRFAIKEGEETRKMTRSKPQRELYIHIDLIVFPFLDSFFIELVCINRSSSTYCIRSQLSIKSIFAYRKLFNIVVF